MLYAILCYNNQDAIGSWSKAQDDAVMAKLSAVQERLAAQHKLGPVARLKPTKTAKTLWKDREPHLIVDGPYAETKEQILGFYVIDCENEAEALDIARELGRATPGGAFELRPISYFTPGSGVSAL
jgi:hypothetical protein